MAYDIHGEVLEGGHCEVHPWVHEEYPCSLCSSERETHQREEKQQRAQVQDAEQIHQLRERVAELEKAIEKAPCGVDASEPGDCEMCNCWKKAALKTDD